MSVKVYSIGKSLINGGGGSGVDSVNGLTGAVTLGGINGIVFDGNNFKLGGTLSDNTTIAQEDKDIIFNATDGIEKASSIKNQLTGVSLDVVDASQNMFITANLMDSFIWILNTVIGSGQPSYSYTDIKINKTSIESQSLDSVSGASGVYTLGASAFSIRSGVGNISTEISGDGIQNTINLLADNGAGLYSSIAIQNSSIVASAIGNITLTAWNVGETETSNFALEYNRLSLGMGQSLVEVHPTFLTYELAGETVLNITTADILLNVGTAARSSKIIMQDYANSIIVNEGTVESRREQETAQITETITDGIDSFSVIRTKDEFTATFGAVLMSFTRLSFGLEYNGNTPIGIGSAGTSFGMSVGYASITLSANTTLNDTHHTVFVDATAGDVTITLPDATTVGGRVYNIKKVDATANKVIVNGAGFNVDGATTQELLLQYEVITVFSAGTQWYII